MTRIDQIKKMDVSQLAELLIVKGTKKETHSYREEDATHEKTELVEGYFTPDGNFFEFYATAKMHTKFWLLEKEATEEITP